jgi:hypothetical protein
MLFSVLRPSGAKEILGPTKGRLGPAIPPPPRGGCVETRTFPRVPHRPLCSGRCFTRGYSPPPRWGEERQLQSLPAWAGSRPPNPDFRPLAAVCRFGSSLAPRPRAFVPPSLRAALIVAYSAFWTLHSFPVMGVPMFPVSRQKRFQEPFLQDFVNP